MRNLPIARVLFSMGCSLIGPGGAVQMNGDVPQSAIAGKVGQLPIIQEVADRQSVFLQTFGVGPRYRSHFKTGEGDEVTVTIGSSDGLVGRLVEHGSVPLSPKEDAKEQQRLQALLSPGKVESSNRQSSRLKPYFLQMIRAMPNAMTFTPVLNPPQLADCDISQLVFDYAPSRNFEPKTLAEASLRDLSGRIWIDAATHHLLRMEIRIDRDFTIAGGILIRVYHGDRVEYEQRRVNEATDAWTHIRLRLRTRELLVHEMDIDADLLATEVKTVAPVPDGPAAVRELLALSPILK